ncbi:MAG TPA: hypothetical protein VES19_01835 [Candidatus Limnocylindrales bacterium]|nr:hypothetical protein [Candidatus Limnocylindrales bacterium]
MTDEDVEAAATRADAGAKAGPEPLATADDEPLPTLQEEFAELTPELQQSMFGKPAQMISGLLIGALLLVALLIGLTTLAKDGPAPGPLVPAPTASPSGAFTAGTLE